MSYFRILEIMENMEGVLEENMEDILEENMEDIGMKRKGDPDDDIQCKRSKSDFINYTLELPTLESIAIVSIATTLCTQPHLKKDLEIISKKYYWVWDKNRESYYESLQDKVEKNLSEIGLPESLNAKIRKLFRPILMQLLKCFRASEEENDHVFKLLMEKGSLRWTMQGTIDKVRSLTDLIDTDSELICLRRLYYLACEYCLEEYVSKLWAKLPCNERDNLYTKPYRYEFHIVIYWTAVMENQEHECLSKIMLHEYDSDYLYSRNSSIYLNMATVAVLNGNPIALKYFWCKLSEQEVQSSLRKWFNILHEKSENLIGFPLYLDYSGHTDILCFLLSYLNEPEEQEKILISHSRVVLTLLFFSWPFQKFFLPTITQIINYLSGFKYKRIMVDMFSEIEKGRKTNELFREVWNMSPVELRETLFDEFPFNPNFWCFNRPVWKLLSVGDLETLYIMLKDTTSPQQKRVIFDVTKDSNELLDILLSGNLELLDELISKKLTVKDVIAFKQEVNNHASFLFYSLTSRGAFQTAEKFLNWVLQPEKKIEQFKKSDSDTSFYHLENWEDQENFNMFMTWYFGNKAKVNDFKQTIVQKFNSSFERELLLTKLCDSEDNAWDMFERFFNWSTKNLYTSRQISQLKKSFLSAVPSIVTLRYFEFATKLLNWCTDSVIAASRFKSQFLLSDRLTDMLVREIYCKNVDWEEVENLMWWFLPLTTDDVAELKSVLDKTIPYRKNKLRDFYRRLDSVIEKFNDPNIAASKKEKDKEPCNFISAILTMKSIL